MSRARGTAAFLATAGALFAVLSLSGPARGQVSKSLAGSPFERAARTDSVASPAAGDSSGAVAGADSLDGSRTDSALAMTDSTKASSDSAAAKAKPRELPPRTLTLRQQVMFAGGFMAFIALMMASMQNFNP